MSEATYESLKSVLKSIYDDKKKKKEKKKKKKKEDKEEVSRPENIAGTY